MDNQLGCGKPKSATGILSVGNAGYDVFIDALKRGIYSGLIREVHEIANKAAMDIKEAIIKKGALVALELSKEVSISQFADELNIKIIMPQIDGDLLVRDTMDELEG